MTRYSLWAPALALMLWLASGSTVLSAQPVTAGAPASLVATAAAPALPASQLEFGLASTPSNSPDELQWMVSSGVPWKYRYTYLSGGVNTGVGWETWNSPAGAYALNYMTASTTAPANYFPVLTYYEICQSNGAAGPNPCYGNDPTADWANVNSAATMYAYYANFKLLMQKAAAYGKPVVVHVEPDFWAYMQQRAAASGHTLASQLTADVKSSGFADVAGYNDNVQGFACGLLHLRDVYGGGNVVMAIHASMWSSGIDVGSDTSSSLNAAAEADKTASFLGSACLSSNPYGGSTWDAVFNDVADHDAGWFEQNGNPRWWDKNNVTFPNFTRYLSWVGELHVKTGLPQVVWQVPEGNQYFLTMNNTHGHYQDNRAEYFIGHAANLFAAGLVGVLFGSGNAAQTENYDIGNTDGITNNNGVPTTDLLGGCSACNIHVSTVADNDGGYLRTFVGLYYAGQAACATAGLGASPGSPQPAGTQVQFTATSTGCTSPLYEFWIQSPNGTWTEKQPYAPGATWNWDTTGLAPGTYAIHAWATQSGTDLTTWEAFGEVRFVLPTPPACATARLSPSSPIQAAGSTINFTASSTGCSSPQYAFYVQYPNGIWYLKQGFGGAAFDWNTSGLAPGIYVVHAWASSTGAGHQAIGSATVTLTGCTSASVSPPSVSQPAGSLVSLTASSGGCPNPLYEFWVLDPTGKWTLVQGFGGASFNWDTSGLPAGTYTVHAWANQQGGAPTLEVYGSSTVSLTNCFSSGLSPSPVSQVAGTVVSLTASSSGCLSPQYAFYVQYPNGLWYLGQASSSNALWNWNTSGLAPGIYTVHAWASATGVGHDSIASDTVTLTGCTSAMLSPASGSTTVGSPVTFTASSSCPNPLYEFWLQYPDGTWHLMRGFSSTTTWQWVTTGLPKGNYTIHVWANNLGYTATYESIGSASYTLS